MNSKPDLTTNLVDELVIKVKQSKKYCAVSEALIRRIATQELAKRSNLRDVVKATRNKLHQVGGAYLDRPVDYTKCLEALEVALTEGKDNFQQVCYQVMCYHSSTRERIPILDRFYRTILAELPPPRRVLDIACGLNPLAISWMNFPSDVEYLAVDIYCDMVNFINQYMSLAGIRGSAIMSDVITDCPTQQVDIAFVLKTIPCLEQIEKNAGMQLINNLMAKHIIVSFPVFSLGGRRDKGMLQNYANRFYDFVADKDWSVKRFDFPSELVYLVNK